MDKQDIWVFGYGSLVWRPGFECAHKETARLNDYVRSFCMWSVHYRGSPEDKGLVLALDYKQGVHCDGVAFRVDGDCADEVLAYLRKRELISAAYLEVQRDITLGSGEVVNAYTYVINPNHDQYAAHLNLNEQAEIIARAVGSVGPNTEYLFNVATHLDEWGIADAELEALVQKTNAILAG